MITEAYSLSKGGEQSLKMWRVLAGDNHIPTYNHKHSDFEISVCLNGSGKYRVGEREYAITGGDVFVFASNEIHFIYEIGGSIELLNLHFAPGLITSGGFNALTEKNITFCFNHSDKFENRITGERAEFISERLKAMFCELKEKNSEYAMAVKTYLCEIILHLIRKCQYAHTSITLQNGAVGKLTRAFEYIDGHFTEEISISELSGIAGFTNNYFSALFKQIYRISPNDYIISKRLDLASRLLNDCPDENVLSIALKCGFNNTANFNKLFKKRYGITPKQFRAYFEL